MTVRITCKHCQSVANAKTKGARHRTSRFGAAAAGAASSTVYSRLQPIHASQNIGTCNPQGGSARAGDYRLSVANAKTKERLPGSPFALAVRAAAADAARSSAAFIDGAKPVKGGAAGAAAAAEAAAGVLVTLAVTLRDRFGNLAPGTPVTGQQSSVVLKPVKQTLQHPSLILQAAALALGRAPNPSLWVPYPFNPKRITAGRAGEEGEVRVTAKGPAEVDFERTGSAEQGALITIAGSYLVCAALGGRLLAGAPPCCCTASEACSWARLCAVAMLC